MQKKDVISIIQLIKKNNIDVWLDGGWAVDALLGQQTRLHNDLDITIQQKDIPKIRKLLTKKDYKDVPRKDTSEWNFVLGDNKKHLIDIHAIIFDKKGNGLYGPLKKGIMYPAGSFKGIGVINKKRFKCISAEYLVKFHTGYKPKDKDYKDVSLLCERFDIKYPKHYKTRF